MNVSDGERLSSILEHLGFAVTDDETQADLIGVVACSVRQTAIDRIFGQAKKWGQWKQRKELVTMLTGCVLPLDQPKMGKIFDVMFP
ncbi:MAG: tRNA (N6-isopentenyl adenosine(37)-C2)-methylthiotransferase MiaB, partial [Candidatus Kerfeldbacteria bacterium]|nr:tRNA (N6-isopentenyl adenosine(37)-C2)-methylthiotransferase MiaB [Candidatus Kerfeldbacteria bacterium]